ncbi:hypothetical protein Tco_0813571 [Tanacetum coccineum]
MKTTDLLTVLYLVAMMDMKDLFETKAKGRSDGKAKEKILCSVIGGFGEADCVVQGDLSCGFYGEYVALTELEDELVTKGILWYVSSPLT